VPPHLQKIAKAIPVDHFAASWAHAVWRSRSNMRVRQR
jgi:hypothetical protein